MKKKFLTGTWFIIGIVIVLVLVSLSFNGQIFKSTDLKNQSVGNHDTRTGNSLGPVSYDIALNTPVSHAQETVLVYRVIPPHYSRRDIIAFGEKFNFSADDRIKESPEGFGIMKYNHSAHLYLKQSGSIEYTNTTREGRINPIDVPENLPSDEEAERIATQFLKDRNIFPDDAVFIGTEHNQIETVKTGAIDWEAIEVWYGRRLNGLKVKGAQLSVEVGGDGNIIDYYSNWRKYETYAEMPLKSPEEALEDLKMRGVDVDASGSPIVISNVTLAYHTIPGTYREEYLEPVWVFSGSVVVNGTYGEGVEEYVPALAVTPDNLTNEDYR